MKSAAEIAALLNADHGAAGAALDDALMTLHGSGEARELCALHRLAASYWADDTAQAAFHNTHAYVYALEAGDEAVTAVLYDTLSRDDRI